MKKIFILLYIYIGIAVAQSSAQDAIFTQFYTTPIQLNPAFAGNTVAPRIGINYRDQWHNISNAYNTFTASYDQYIEPLNSGFGFTLLADKAGDGIYRKNNAAVSYAYRLRTRSGTNFKIGVEAGVGQISLDWDKLVFLDMIDPINGQTGTLSSKEARPTNLTNNYFDASAGFLVYNKHWYGGLSFKHLNSPNQSLINDKLLLNTGLPILYSLQTGYEIVLSKNNKKRTTSFITPNLLIARQGNFMQINIGAQAGMGAVFGGLGFRHTFRNSDAILVNAGVKKGIMKFCYSHDITINGLPGSFGAHEVSLILNFDELIDHSKVNYSDCFNFMR
jgi:type IX secretion system PorP/SprF family membrane protein